jgi:hypothetical protein
MGTAQTRAAPSHRRIYYDAEAMTRRRKAPCSDDRLSCRTAGSGGAVTHLVRDGAHRDLFLTLLASKHGVILGKAFEGRDACVALNSEMPSRRRRDPSGSVPDSENWGAFILRHLPQNDLRPVPSMPQEYFAGRRSHVLHPLRLLPRHCYQVAVVGVLGPGYERRVELTGTAASHLEDDGPARTPWPSRRREPQPHERVEEASRESIQQSGRHPGPFMIVRCKRGLASWAWGRLRAVPDGDGPNDAPLNAIEESVRSNDNFAMRQIWELGD